MSLTILHHLGLGDHIVCHGLVRYFAEHQDISLFCKHHNAQSVGAMYRDLPVNLIRITDLSEALSQIRNESTLAIIVHDNDPITRSGMSFDEIFYHRSGVPFNAKWDKFFIPTCSTYIEAPNQPYAVVHQDNRFKINTAGIDLPIYYINQGITDNIFDFRVILENAAEIHVIDSTIMFMADQFKCKGKKYVHRYARPNPLWCLPKLTPDWIILT